MKFIIKSLALLLAFGALTTTACKKDDDKSRSDILVDEATWVQVKSEEQDPTTGAWSEVTIEDCSKDDTYTFKADKSLVFDEGATKCNDADPQSSTGTWAFSADETTLTLTIDGFGLAFVVESFSADKMVVTNALLGTRDTFQPK